MSHAHGGAGAAAAAMSLNAVGAAPMTMQMAFSFSTDCGPLLFEFWHPHGLVQYALSLCIVFMLGMSAEWLSLHARQRDLRKTDSVDDPAKRPLYDGDSDSSQPPFPATSAKARVVAEIRSKLLLHAASIAVNLCVMLLAMTFNAGVFACVVLGLATGRTVWGSTTAQAGSRSSAESCH